MCGRQWDGRYGGEMNIPGELPKPEDAWLIRNTSDEQTQQIIETILFQTRMHYTMFQHALNMGNMMGHGMMWE